MKIETILMNDPVLVVEEKTEKIMVAVKFQTMLPLEKFIELMTIVKERGDGTFETTLEPKGKV